jgi:allantoinase
MPDWLIRGGDVVTSVGVSRADIAVEDGLIAAVGRDFAGSGRELDASGMTILPGLIDVHLHFNEPGRAHWEGAATGSRALAAGGGTVFFDMPLNSSPCTLTAPDFYAKRMALRHSSVTDFALWGGLVPGNVGNLEELADCGVVGFKAFLADSGLAEFPRADDRTLLEGMRTAARLGLPVAVHAENDEITRDLTRRAIEAGRVSARDFLASRPVVAEVEAIQRAGLLAAETGVKLHVVHVSSGRGVAAALEARARGADISIETCPHYLFFTEEDVERLGAVAKCAPPLRSQSEQESLWRHVLAGDVDAIASDHSPAPPAMKTGDDFFAIWGGIAGVQSTLAALIDAGHFARELPLARIAEMTAAFPARRFGIAAKGSIAPGFDADLAFVDLSASHILRQEDLQQRHPLSPYTGVHFRGSIRRTMLRGQTVCEDGKITASACGRMLRPRPAMKNAYASTRTHS